MRNAAHYRRHIHHRISLHYTQFEIIEKQYFHLILLKTLHAITETSSCSSEQPLLDISTSDPCPSPSDRDWRGIRGIKPCASLPRGELYPEAPPWWHNA